MEDYEHTDGGGVHIMAMGKVDGNGLGGLDIFDECIIKECEGTIEENGIILKGVVSGGHIHIRERYFRRCINDGRGLFW